MLELLKSLNEEVLRSGDGANPYLKFEFEITRCTSHQLPHVQRALDPQMAKAAFSENRSASATDTISNESGSIANGGSSRVETTPS